MLLRLFVSFGLLVASATAQLTLSTIRGAVSDQTGAVIANTQIALTEVQTNQLRSVTSNENGDFEILDLRPGTYRLVATAPGFKNFVADNILLVGNEIRRVNVGMEIGSANTEVSVTAGAAVISTDSSKLLTTISGSKYADVPWVGAEATSIRA